jgi:VWFA-related protein
MAKGRIARSVQRFVLCMAAAGILNAVRDSCAAQQNQQATAPRDQQGAPTPSVSLTPRSHEERASRYQAQHRILLNVQVTDSAGKPVTGLKQEDFAVLDNDQARKLTASREVDGTAPDGAAHVILVIDAVNNSLKAIAYQRREIEKFFAQDPSALKLPTTIGVLTSAGLTTGEQSKDRAVLTEELRSLTRNLRAFECPEDKTNADLNAPQPLDIGAGSMEASIANAGVPRTHRANCMNLRFRTSVTALNRLATKQTDVPGRAIVIWVGAGWPLLRDPDFQNDSAAVKRNFFDYLVELSTALREGQVTLDAVSSPELVRSGEKLSEHDVTYVNGMPNESETSAASLALPMLAHQSGGLILEGSKDLATELAACVADAQAYYALAFDSASARAPGELHLMNVKVNKPGLTVRTDTSYYAAQ